MPCVTVPLNFLQKRAGPPRLHMTSSEGLSAANYRLGPMDLLSTVKGLCFVSRTWQGKVKNGRLIGKDQMLLNNTGTIDLLYVFLKEI